MRVLSRGSRGKLVGCVVPVAVSLVVLVVFGMDDGNCARAVSGELLAFLFVLVSIFPASGQ